MPKIKIQISGDEWCPVYSPELPDKFNAHRLVEIEQADYDRICKAFEEFNACQEIMLEILDKTEWL